MKDYLAIAIALVAVGVALLGGSDRVVTLPGVGGPGTTQTEKWEFLDGLLANEFEMGAGVLQYTATSTQTGFTLTAAQLRDNSQIDMVSTDTVTQTLTLPATSTITTFLVDAGTCRSWLINNLHAAATTTTIAAGTGWDLMAPSTADDVIDGLESSWLTACRQVDGDITGILSDENVHAD